MKITTCTWLLLLILLACTNIRKRHHDGVYVYTDTSQQSTNVQRIKVDGKWMYHTIQSTKGNRKTEEYKFVCIQYPDKISIPLLKGHSVAVEIDKEGNLMYDGMLFKREFIRIIDPAPIPEALKEAIK